MFPARCLFAVTRRIRPRVNICRVLFERRSYAIRDRYIFPPKKPSPEQLAAEAKLKEQAELNRQKQMDETAKRMRTNKLTEVRIKEPTDDVRFFQLSVPTQPKKPRSMTVALVGIPNAGKSTLVNRMVGSKVSAVSRKAQTTRSSTLGIVTIGSTQLCFIDTPGVIDRNFQKKYGFILLLPTPIGTSRVKRDLVVASWNAVEEADTVLIDCVKTIDENVLRMVDKLRNLKAEEKTPPMLLVLNKADLVASIESTKRYDVLERIKRHIPDLDTLFGQTFIISALNGNNVAQLQNFLVDAAPAQEWSYDSSLKTDQSALERVEEVVREKIFKFLNHELPYQLSLETIGWTPKKNGALRIDLNVYVKKESQKKILWGTKGLIIASIQREATEDIQSFIDRPVELYLTLKVRKHTPEEELDLNL